MFDHDSSGRRPYSTIRTYVAPLAVLIVALAMMSGLVLLGVVKGNADRTSVVSTTEATVQIAP